MKTNDITKAKNPAMRGALNALIRAAAAARKIAIQTDTHLVIFKDGQIQRLSADELRLQAETKDDSTSTDCNKLERITTQIEGYA